MSQNWSCIVHRHTLIDHFVSHATTVARGGFRAAFWEPSKDLRVAMGDLVHFLEFLSLKHQEFDKGATSHLMVLCNRIAVHDLLLHHSFHHS